MKRRIAALVLGLLATVAAALEVLELDARSVVVHGEDLRRATGAAILLRVSGLGDTLRRPFVPGRPWLVDGNCEPETRYRWLLDSDDGIAATLWLEKRVVERPLGLLELRGPDGSYALLHASGETSCAEFLEFCDASGWPLPPEQNYPRMRNYLQFFRDYPVVNVCVEDAVAYCNWLSAVDGLDPAYGASGRLREGAGGWRLPTVREMTWLAERQREEPHWARQGSEPAPRPRLDRSDPFGAQHVEGNVWEWCENGFGRADEGACASHARWFSPAGRDSRLVFGGSFNNSPQELARLVTAQDPSARLSTLGFRVVRWLPVTGGVDFDGILDSAQSADTTGRRR